MSEIPNMSQALSAREIADLADSISTQIIQSIHSPSGGGYTNSNTLGEALEIQKAAKLLRKHSFYRATPNASQSAKLVQSGYKWTCPNCTSTNRAAELPGSKTLTCPKCEKEFAAETIAQAA